MLLYLYYMIQVVECGQFCYSRRPCWLDVPTYAVVDFIMLVVSVQKKKLQIVMSLRYRNPHLKLQSIGGGLSRRLRVKVTTRILKITSTHHLV